MGQSQRGSQSLRRRSFRAAGVTLASVFSLLLWSRLKMVTDTPRMVYADPKSAEATGAEPLSPTGLDRLWLLVLGFWVLPLRISLKSMSDRHFSGGERGVPSLKVLAALMERLTWSNL